MAIEASRKWAHWPAFLLAYEFWKKVGREKDSSAHLEVFQREHDLVFGRLRKVHVTRMVVYKCMPSHVGPFGKCPLMIKSYTTRLGNI